MADAVAYWRAAGAGDDSIDAVVAAALVVADEVGGSTAVPLERAAASLRARAAADDERTGWSAQARLSARVLAALPVGVLALLAASDRDVRSLLLSPLGATVVVAGLALDALGFWWMHRIVRSAAA